jgi:ABC-type polysaccharide/polyol phosphate transport system ATPase subunit
MLPEGSIAATHIWKRFRSDRARRLLRDRVENWNENLVPKRRALRWRWALRDVNLVAAPGESVGLIGVNGSGKSTLLKILTRVMYPYAGSVNVVGRVGALIEVRAGIHPDLTGKENVFLYGTLIGLGRHEIGRLFDDIVDFAGLADAIDRPVKFYSSGMQLRLGFAVSAFLQPNVLLVDEVLAVGDASFQQRCLDKMRAVLAQGTTLVFVSHDLAAVEAVCGRTIWLDNGLVRADGATRDVLSGYRNSIRENAEIASPQDGPIRVITVDVAGPNNGVPKSQQSLDISINLESTVSQHVQVCVGVSEGLATPVLAFRRELHLTSGALKLTCYIPRLPLPKGRFCVWVGVLDRRNADLIQWHPTAYFDVYGPALDPTPRGVLRLAPVHADCQWQMQT